MSELDWGAIDAPDSDEAQYERIGQYLAQQHPPAEAPKRGPLASELAAIDSALGALDGLDDVQATIDRAELTKRREQIVNRVPLEPVATDALEGVAEIAQMEYEAKTREAETWDKDSAHRAVLQREAEAAFTKASHARYEAKVRAELAAANEAMDNLARTEAVRRATVEAKSRAKANLEEVSRLAGIDPDVDPGIFRAGDPKDRLPAWEVERARHEYENATPDPLLVERFYREIRESDSADRGRMGL